ncbi:hypothetical protein Moror_9767 [Moniliophthora roreri MCA 2997]|uniref:Uncharacterized protein n=1 Tax=Moniliophthora roreri (strain MCA 2997) TaxID=1381753 RepID=V2Y4L6_MONRO|nr:hypothetical protein Moror_9767 [Moniliophthora roreri MCA 2997]
MKQHVRICTEVDLSMLGLQHAAMPLMRPGYTSSLANACLSLVEAGDNEKLCGRDRNLSNTQDPIFVILFDVSLLETDDVKKLYGVAHCSSLSTRTS